MKFKVGDRVAVYSDSDQTGSDWRVVGNVVRSDGDGLVRVRIDGRHEWNFHEKQCRKLVKKQRQSVWIHKRELKLAKELGAPAWDEPWEGENGEIKRSDFIEFVEVKRK
jgi:hypothetical protein